MARDVQAQLKSDRAAEHDELVDIREHREIDVGDSVWLYMAKVKPGLTKKLAHLWHGPFRVLERREDYMYKLRVDGQVYKFFPWVHATRLRRRSEHPDRPVTALPRVDEDDDFDAALLPEDSWEADEEAGEYEVEGILDVRWDRDERTGRRIKRYLLKWTGYEEPQWVEAAQMSCGRLQHEFDRSQTARARLAAMQGEEDSHL